ncbi:hypothetical protein BDQ17DRAFT_364186 [Cyathus striatus]|nr:hypothetical protein BDQ17DRAFT_364186 [Cyathus striatus]
MEPYEIDNFILRNGKLLSTCAWEFYNIQSPDIVSLRTTLFLRTIVVDVEPFQEVLHTWFDVTVPITRRLIAVTRLFRIILDVNSPLFDVEGRQWRSNVVDIFYFFFSAIWDDASDEVRLAANTLSSTLLPVHFEAISRCWDELLAKAPVMEKIKLMTFLTQLRPHFPRWKVLSWTAIIEALTDYSYGNDSHPIRNDISLYNTGSPVDLDTMHLRVSILLLSLQMIADGIATDDITLLKIKAQLAEIVGFEDVSITPSSRKIFIYFGSILARFPMFQISHFHASKSCISTGCTLLFGHILLDFRRSGCI